ncbi:MAG: gluconokinase [Rhodobacteraceae bacterium]|nr:gluconokinase [Paracoccaceae bacterium]
MGVSGCGKSSVGRALAARLGARFLDADDFHPPANIAKMSKGKPLQDDDRWPWLDAVGRSMAELADGRAVAACSALRRAYRDRLAAATGEPVVFIYLRGTKDVITTRLKNRSDHFMPPALLDSQFATLEPPSEDENVLVVDIGPPVQSLVVEVLRKLRSSDPTR